MGAGAGVVWVFDRAKAQAVACDGGTTAPYEIRAALALLSSVEQPSTRRSIRGEAGLSSGGATRTALLNQRQHVERGRLHGRLLLVCRRVEHRRYQPYLHEEAQRDRSALASASAAASAAAAAAAVAAAAAAAAAATDAGAAM